MSPFGKTSNWIARYRSVHPQVSCRDHDPKFGAVFVRGQGARLWDVEGHDFIDLTCGYSAANFGQCFPPLVAAASKQLSQLTHLTGEAHVSRIELAEKLVEHSGFPPATTKVIFNVSGARAVETAWKAAHAYRPGKLLTLGPSYHGRSIATSLLSAQTARSPSGYEKHQFLQTGVVSCSADDYPYCAACPLQLDFPSCELRCVQSVFDVLASHADELSAVLVEPAIGARGYIFPPPEFFVGLRAATQAAGVLMIADEIQTGLGRCGSWALSQQQGWQPDLMVLGKSLGGGIAPISAVLGRADILDALRPGSESETFAASPLATAVGLEVLEQLQHGPWIANGQRLGQEFRDFATREISRRAISSQAMRQHFYADCVVEGLGASCVIEFRRQPERCRRFAEACFEQRVLTHFTGPQATRLVLLPPFTMTDAECDAALSRLTLAFDDCAN